MCMGKNKNKNIKKRTNIDFQIKTRQHLDNFY